MELKPQEAIFSYTKGDYKSKKILKYCYFSFQRAFRNKRCSPINLQYSQQVFYEQRQTSFQPIEEKFISVPPSQFKKLAKVTYMTEGTKIMYHLIFHLVSQESINLLYHSCFVSPNLHPLIDRSPRYGSLNCENGVVEDQNWELFDCLSLRKRQNIISLNSGLDRGLRGMS